MTPQIHPQTLQFAIQTLAIFPNGLAISALTRIGRDLPSVSCAIHRKDRKLPFREFLRPPLEGHRGHQVASPKEWQVITRQKIEVHHQLTRSNNKVNHSGINFIAVKSLQLLQVLL